jgi:Rieske Fe-S protein
MQDITRRDFIKLVQQGLALTGVAALFTPIVSYFFPAKLEEMPSDPVLVAGQEELGPGDSRTVAFGRYPALVIHTEEGLRAFSAVCTHFACICKWDPDLEQIVCPCHEGYFDPLDGHVLHGPPPTPLMQLNVQVVDGKIYVGGQG